MRNRWLSRLVTLLSALAGAALTFAFLLPRDAGAHTEFQNPIQGAGITCSIDNRDEHEQLYNSNGRVCNGDNTNDAIVECNVPGYSYELCDITSAYVYYFDGHSADSVVGDLGTRGHSDTNWTDCAVTETSSSAGTGNGTFTFSPDALSCMNTIYRSLVFTIDLPDDDSANFDSCVNAWHVEPDYGGETCGTGP